jgi:alpha-mannosidase
MISGEIVKGVSANKNLEVTDQCLFLFGNGDGGGGPTPLMMEKVSTLALACPSILLLQVTVRDLPLCGPHIRIRDWTDEQLERLSSLGHAPEVPKIKMGSPIDFFDDLCRKTDGGRRLPTWKGELYLELHRGVSHTLLRCLLVWK